MIADAAAQRAAALILEQHLACRERFAALTRRARDLFESRDWPARQQLSAARLDLYGAMVAETLDRLRPLLGERLADRPAWSMIRGAVAARIAERDDRELAETFHNSITRRVFETHGVDPAVEFVLPVTDPGPPPAGAAAAPGLTSLFLRRADLAVLLGDLLREVEWTTGYAHAAEDAALAAAALQAQLPDLEVQSIEMARPVFFRAKGAYLVGRLQARPAGGGTPVHRPLLLALANRSGRVEVDAVLAGEDEVSIVFSFARSYFFVDVPRPAEMVHFLRCLMPRKPVAELYSALGFDKHGKTELYRSLMGHLATSADRFEIAPGQRGMVMSVFTLPGFDVVFKVLRDRFDDPKTVTHQEVMAKYRLVFRHDRAGRLADVQQFEHLEFEVGRFTEELLRELLETASERVRVEGGRVLLSHLYTERRLRPLDMYLREADGEAARRAVLDYGQVMRDLAAANIFPGDMLLKNFGVSRHGRLIFYDYDELCALTDCRFRELPSAGSDFEETAGEPWFYVGPRDIFPEEFRSFLGLGDDLRRLFLEAHGELLCTSFWRGLQERHRRGEVVDIYPYRAAHRLRPDPGAEGAAPRPGASRGSSGA